MGRREALVIGCRWVRGRGRGIRPRWGASGLPAVDQPEREGRGRGGRRALNAAVPRGPGGTVGARPRKEPLLLMSHGTTEDSGVAAFRQLIGGHDRSGPAGAGVDGGSSNWPRPRWEVVKRWRRRLAEGGAERSPCRCASARPARTRGTSPPPGPGEGATPGAVPLRAAARTAPVLLDVRRPA